MRDRNNERLREGTCEIDEPLGPPAAPVRFTGDTRKAVFAGGLEGVPVVPIQGDVSSGLNSRKFALRPHLCQRSVFTSRSVMPSRLLGVEPSFPVY